MNLGSDNLMCWCSGNGQRSESAKKWMFAGTISHRATRLFSSVVESKGSVPDLFTELQCAYLRLDDRALVRWSRQTQRTALCWMIIKSVTASKGSFECTTYRVLPMLASTCPVSSPKVSVICRKSYGFRPSIRVLPARSASITKSCSFFDKGSALPRIVN